MKLEFQLEERTPTVVEFDELRRSVGWRTGDAEAFEHGLRKSLYAVCALVEGLVVGTARVVGDESTCFYVQDVIVRPEHQRMGIGTALMEKAMSYIDRSACAGAVVGIMVAKNREAFYEKFGFWQRPNEEYGPGMMQFWRESEW
ncbi:MAG: GNAT family N-acetyltransferase [Gaiellaceae bacterium]|jgi:GNAT superfamily N-acetyltransferase